MVIQRFSPDYIGGIICIIIGLMSILEAKRLYPYGVGLLTGDHTFPGILGVILIIGGGFLLFGRSRDTGNPIMPKGKTKLKMIASIVILLFYCSLISIIGYFFSTLAAFACLFTVIGGYRWLFSLLLSVVLTAFLYCLIIVLLKIPFPGGTLF